MAAVAKRQAVMMTTPAKSKPRAVYSQMEKQSLLENFDLEGEFRMSMWHLWGMKEGASWWIEYSLLQSTTRPGRSKPRLRQRSTRSCSGKKRRSSRFRETYVK